MTKKTKQNTQVENLIDSYEKVVVQITNYFIAVYFKDVPTDFYWIGEEIGGTLFINDMFFSVDDLLDFLKYDYTPDEMNKCYWERVEKFHKPEEVIPNIKNWKLLKQK